MSKCVKNKELAHEPQAYIYRALFFFRCQWCFPQIPPPYPGYAKTYVRLSRTGRNLVWTCQPLAWIFCGTGTVLIRKNKETVENYLQIMAELIFISKVIKANLILDKISLHIPFNFAIPQSFHYFVFTSSILVLSQKQFTRVIVRLKALNAWLFLSFEFWTKLFGQELLGFGQPNLIHV